VNEREKERERKREDEHLDLSGISCKEGEESLSSAVDDVDFMQTDSVHDFLSLLDLSFGTVDKLDLCITKQYKAMGKESESKEKHFWSDSCLNSFCETERKNADSGAGNVVITSTGERSSDLCDATTCFVDCDHISFVCFFNDEQRSDRGKKGRGRGRGKGKGERGKGKGERGKGKGEEKEE